MGARIYSTDRLTIIRGSFIFNYMVEQRTVDLDAVFHALSDPTRRAMLYRLVQGEATVGDLAAPYRMSLAAASKHIRVLEGAGLIRRTVRGRSHLCRLDATAMHAGQEWIRHFERFWTERLDALEAILNEEDDLKGEHDDEA
jgi:DNA-binding transcriptional ArsR family regulator